MFLEKKIMFQFSCNTAEYMYISINLPRIRASSKKIFQSKRRNLSRRIKLEVLSNKFKKNSSELANVALAESLGWRACQFLTDKIRGWRKCAYKVVPSNLR